MRRQTRAVVAQLDRATGYELVGWGFESLRPRFLQMTFLLVVRREAICRRRCRALTGRRESIQAPKIVDEDRGHQCGKAAKCVRMHEEYRPGAHQNGALGVTPIPIGLKSRSRKVHSRLPLA